MPVAFKGGTSGDSYDYLPKVPAVGESQPVLMTETSGGVPGTVHLQAENYEVEHSEHATPDFLPTGGSLPDGSEDFQQQDIRGLKFSPAQGIGEYFKGATDLGDKLGPA